ncbi:aldehyde dehydrogenase family protein [Stieleria sp. TO1_6]|uniref:aldehyde dehydrogenase family protein n=1 Tax=Stieleria tagensis TaxID=2956795 RepID=UPI00209B8B9B|nr:aldehyde dehydrogenase family protein [Stieleria tagensis]MCO8120958.1 aldehyde dehydrogenase family protein [Stieleria tagensis]
MLRQRHHQSSHHESDWQHLANKQRCQIVGSAAGEFCERSDKLIDACASAQRIDPVETIASELIPLCAALRYLGKRGARVLAPRRVGFRGRPIWMFGVRSVVHRVPLGDVLVLGTWNYPLLLAGVQIAQALAAGNRVLFKPAEGTQQSSEIMAECFYSAGVPRSQLSLLETQTAAATTAIEGGVDLIVLTGAASTGRKVLQSAAPQLSASIMELSGCDAAIALPGFDLDRLLDALQFGLRFNASATCIGPRRLMLRQPDRDAVLSGLVSKFGDEPAVIVHPAARENVARQIDAALESGARDLLGRYDSRALLETGKLHPVVLDGVTESDSIASADLFAPVLSLMTVRDNQHAARLVNDCPYRLAASVFGPVDQASELAERLAVGTVTINDLIAPTGDPRVPFGGRGQSGFGVTRGPEGLLAMTAAKVISTRRGSFTLHLRPRQSRDKALLHGALHWLYGGSLGKRLAGLRQIVDGVKKT